MTENLGELSETQMTTLLHLRWEEEADLAKELDVPQLFATLVTDWRMHDIAIKGPCILEHNPSEHFSDEGAETFRSVFINPTWRDVLIFCHVSIQAVKDEHHRFIEDVDKTPSRMMHGLPVYEIHLGS